MSDLTHVVGIDPGLVHTGLVRMVFDRPAREVVVEHEVVVGPDAEAVRLWTHDPVIKPVVFIEAYRPRSNFGTDERMVKAVTEMQAAIPKAKVLQNMGVKKVVKKPLMELLQVWDFSTRSNHQDLRSAARIALLGMMKDEELNELLADVVSDHLKQQSWHVAC